VIVKEIDGGGPQEVVERFPLKIGEAGVKVEKMKRRHSVEVVEEASNHFSICGVLEEIEGLEHFPLKVAESVEGLEKDSNHFSIYEILEIDGVKPLKIAKVVENVVIKEEKVKTLHLLIAKIQEGIEEVKSFAPKVVEALRGIEKVRMKDFLLHYWRAFFGIMEIYILKRIKILPDQYFLTLFQY
jgi:hypothetical protein